MIPVIARFAPVGECAVRQFERLLGVSLPADYFNFLSQAKGWALALVAFINVPGVDEPVMVTDFLVVTGEWERRIDEEYAAPDIAENNIGTPTSVPSEFLLIADANTGQFVMDLRESNFGEIYYFDHLYLGHKHVNPSPFLSREFFESRGLDGDDRFRYVKVAVTFTDFVDSMVIEEPELR
jgi:hypothetical protein